MAEDLDVGRAELAAEDLDVGRLELAAEDLDVGLPELAAADRTSAGRCSMFARTSAVWSPAGVGGGGPDVGRPALEVCEDVRRPELATEDLDIGRPELTAEALDSGRPELAAAG